MALPMEQYNRNILVLIPDYEPSMTMIIKSGWEDYYHVIYENPENGDLTFETGFVSAWQLKNRYGLTDEDFNKIKIGGVK